MSFSIAGYRIIAMKNRALVILFVVQTIAVCESAILPKILLPFYGNYQVNYTIDAEEGCYQWKSLREEVATISPIESTFDITEQCSKSALVVVTSTEPIRKTTLVLATNVKTGTVFQSDVIVDRINTIDIVSRTRELYLTDPPEELKIRALDQEGNTFSSTAGMEFEWTLAQDEVSRKDGASPHPPVSAHSILHIQKFRDTIYVAEPYVDILENKGKMSDTILISGIQTGAAVVVANLVSTMECHIVVKPCSVRFIVRDKIMLNPSHDIYLIKHMVVRYKVERWKEGRATEVAMPSLQYILNVRDMTNHRNPAISLNQEHSIITALHTGHSQVYLIDQHLKHYDDSLMEQATSDVHVVEAAYLRFEIEPYNKWILEVGRIYSISVHIYSESNKRIYGDVDNVRLTGTFDSKYLEVLETVKNGSWFLVKTLMKGSCDITSLLKGVVIMEYNMVQAGLFSTGSENLEALDSPIFTSQNLEIFERITVSPSLVVFPWQPYPVKHKYTLKAVGGSGNYTWTVNETKFTSISFSGQVVAQSGTEEKQGPRVIEAKATDIRNGYHHGDATIVLSPPAKLQFALSRLEAEVERSLNLYVAMYAKINNEFVPFSDCSSMEQINWSIHDTSIFEFSEGQESVPDQTCDPTPQLPSCLKREVRALKEGHTTVSLSYFHEGMNQTLQASTVIAAYSPLKIIDPSQLAVIALGSSKIMTFEGGPNPWPLLPNNYEKIIKGDSENANFHEQLSGREHTFIAKCVHLGVDRVTLTIQNRPCNTNPFPQKSEIIIQLSCSIPASIKMTTEYLPTSCPLHQNQNVHMVALAGDTIRITLSAYDKYGNQFDNFTSLSSRWIHGTLSEVSPASIKSEFLPNSNGQTKHHILHDLHIQNDIGQSKLEVSIEKYQDFVERDICSKHDCKIMPPVNAALILNVVQVVTLTPQSVVMFNRPNFTSSVLISGGSGHFNHEIKTESGSEVVATHQASPTERALTLNPITAGHAFLIVHDLCIPKATVINGAQSRSSVTVSDLSSLFLTVTNPIEVGTTGKATIQLDMRKLSEPGAFDLNIQLSSEPLGIVAIEKVKKGDNQDFLAEVNALKVGTVTIKATTTSRDGKLIASNIVKVIVFPPLDLKPPRITVIRGSEFHVYADGGPPEDVQLYYDVTDQNIASSSTNGILTALALGNTTVKVRAVTKDGQIFHGRSETSIFVVQIQGVWIDSPTFRFQTGATVPLHVYGYAGRGYDPVNLDSSAAGLVFKWKVNNHAILGLRTVFSSSGVVVPEALRFTMLIDGKSPGQSHVSVSVSATRLSLKQLTKKELDAEIQVTVFDPLIISQEKLWTSRNNLLLTPETSYTFHSNRDELSTRMNYVSLCDACVVNVTSQNYEGCISINRELKSVTTGRNPCEGTVLVSSEERFSAIQSVSIHVRVRLVSYLIPHVQDKFYLIEQGKYLTGFPLGSELSIKIHQYDSFGDQFDATNPDASFDVNRNDILEITPDPAQSVVKAQVSQVGAAIIRVWSEKDLTFSYPLNIISTIKGENGLVSTVVGVRKCFTSTLVDSEGEGGKWSVKTGTFSVDLNSGAVMPLSSGTDELNFHLDNVVSKVSLVSEKFTAKFETTLLPEFVSNTESEYILPIKLSESNDFCHGLDADMDKFAQTTFNCEGFLVNTIEAVTVFEVKTAYLSKLGSYACILERTKLSPKLEEKVSTFDDASFTLALAILPDATDRGISLQSPVNVRFQPAFKLINDSQIIMTEKKLSLCVSATFEIHKSIEITIDSRNLEIKKPDAFTDGISCYEISYVFNENFIQKQEVKIMSSLTQQECFVEIIIKLIPQFLSSITDNQFCTDPAPYKQSWLMYQYSFSYLSLLIALLVIFITTILIFLTCGFFKWAFSPPPTSPSNTATPVLGPRRSPVGMVPYSPSGSYLFPRSSPVQRGSPHSTSPSPRKPRLWSTFYQPQDAGVPP